MMLIDRFLSDEQDPKAVEKVLGKLNDMLTTNEELIYLAVQKKPAVNLLPDCIAVSTKRIFYCEPANFGITMNFKDISWKSIKEVSFKEELFGSKFICVPQHGENIITEYIPKVQARKLYQAAYEQLEGFKEQQLAAEADRRAQQPGAASDRHSSATDIPFIDITPSPAADYPSKNTGRPDTDMGTADAASTSGSLFNPASPDVAAGYKSPFPPAAPAGAAEASGYDPSAAKLPPYVSGGSASASAPVEEPEDETTLKLRKLKTLYDKQLITLEEYEAKKADILDSF
jgi:hypothetical protein